MAKDTGNAVAANFAADEVTTSTYDANDRLQTEIFDGTANDTNTRYAYSGTEQTGKTVRQGTTIDQGSSVSQTTYAFDLQGRMKQGVATASGTTTTTTYQYNDDGIRVSQTEQVGTGAAITTVFHVSPQNPTGYSQVLEEGVDANADGRLQATEVGKTYTLGMDVIAQQAPAVASGATLYLLKDGHGSTRVVVNGSGAVQQRYAYEAYGTLLVGAGLTSDPSAALTDHLYNGESFSANTGLYDFRDRLYDPRLGRFTSLDAYAGDDQSPQSLHKYLYTHGNPINFNDPTGMFESSLSGLSLGMTIGSMFDAIVIPSIIEVGKYAGVAVTGAAVIYTIQLQLALDTTFVVSHTVSAEFLGEFARELPKVDIKARVEALEDLLKQAWNVYLHYSYAMYAPSLLLFGLTRNRDRNEGPWATRTVYPSGMLAKLSLALPNPVPPDAVYIVSPRERFQPYMSRYVLAQPDRDGNVMPGGGYEYVFGPQGSGGPGTVFPPIPIPRDL